jgi:hypothetical protein
LRQLCDVWTRKWKNRKFRRNSVPLILTRPKQGSLMQIVLVIFIPLAVLAACSQQPESASSANQCKSALALSNDEKNFDQCIATCIKCENGVVTTCATSCRLKGAK